MEINYKNSKIKAVCTNISEAVKKYRIEMAKKIHLRIDQLRAAESIDTLLKHSIGKCHKLKGNRKEQYAMHLEEPYRLVFVVSEGKIQIARILEIVDYH